MRDFVSIHHVVEPVALARLEDGLEAEGSLPAPRPGAAGQRKLALVAIPGSDEMDGLDIGRGTKSEAQLGCHYFLFFKNRANWPDANRQLYLGSATE